VAFKTNLGINQEIQYMQENSQKILLVGAKGTLGSAIAAELGERHQIIGASRHSSEVKINIDDLDSIREALEQVGMIDAVICAAGEVEFAPLEKIPPAKFDNSIFTLGIVSKLMGQINLTLAALPYLRDKGSITLITGILADEPIAMGVPATTIDCAIEGFVRSAAIERIRRIDAPFRQHFPGLRSRPCRPRRSGFQPQC
jgi:NAD(P)-dependent dehydrogenase (short-subunit alcohol dehydrogenase family)